MKLMHKNCVTHDIVVIVGPTASGKSCFAVEVAQLLDGEIISADSMQIYKYMDIGTAKPSVTQRAQVRHHMIDIVHPIENYSVAKFAVDARKAIADVLSRERVPILVGGTGLYIDSIINNVKFFGCPKDQNYREMLEKLAQEKGLNFVHDMLLSIDPIAYERINSNDLRRVIRALEVYKITGKSITEQHKYSKMDHLYNPLIIGLSMERSILYDRINARVDDMLSNGLIREVELLLEMSVPQSASSMQAIGYKELTCHMLGELNFEQARSQIKQKSRNYAKRQLTWFRKNQNINWIFVNKNDAAEGSIVEKLFLKNDL